jgi:hypothetical protein
VAEAATILPVTPVAHPPNSVVIGGLHSKNKFKKPWVTQEFLNLCKSKDKIFQY